MMEINEYGINLKGYIEITKILKPKSIIISQLGLNEGDILELSYKIKCTRIGGELSSPMITITNLSNNLSKDVYINKFIGEHMGGFWNKDEKKTFKYKVVEK